MLMRNLIYTLYILFFTISLNSQWQWQNPLPQGNTYFDIDFIDSLNGFVCGQFGTIIKTTDGGSKWTTIKTNLVKHITSISFYDKNEGWFVVFGDSSKYDFYKTNNGGLNWNKISFIQGSGIVSFNALSFINRQIGYFTSFEGLHKTTDGGSSWQLIPSINPSSPVYFLNETTGWVGVGSKLCKTTNNGALWTPITLPGNNLLVRSVFFLNENIGYLGCSYFQQEKLGKLLRTTNGGFTWLENEFEHIVTDVHFNSNDTGWVCIDNEATPRKEKIFQTINGCSTWETFNITAHRFDFVNKKKAFALSNNNIVSSTSNGWQTSKRLTPSITTFSLFNLDVLDSNVIYACGERQTVVGSTNSGNTWNNYSCECSDFPLYGIFIKNDKEIWATGYGGTILHSFNGGIDWLEQIISTNELMDIAFVNDTLAFVVGFDSSGGAVFKSTDGGENWNKVPFFSGEYYIHEIKISHNRIWLSCSDKMITSSDLGSTWSVISDPSYYPPFSVYKNILWKLSGNKILKTSNFGQSWLTNLFSPNSSIRGMHSSFVDSLNGFIQCYDGELFKTTDGGLSWAQHPKNFYQYLSSIEFESSTHGWGVGSNGIIVRYNNNILSALDFKEISNTTSNFELYQNYPNPFNPSTVIKFKVESVKFITIKVYDVLGRELATLVNEVKQPGMHEVEFSKDKNFLSSGIYFYQLKSGNKQETRKMILLK
jgi:photosystem II stability/assembly factor-like uncharacterized protein